VGSRAAPLRKKRGENPGQGSGRSPENQGSKRILGEKAASFFNENITKLLKPGQEKAQTKTLKNTGG